MLVTLGFSKGYKRKFTVAARICLRMWYVDQHSGSSYKSPISSRKTFELLKKLLGEKVNAEMGEFIHDCAELLVRCSLETVANANTAC
jgi:hypothetical protein